MRRISSYIALSVSMAFAVASPASAHFVLVTPAGKGGGPNGAVHVGQLPPAHNSCFGLSMAATSENSHVVRFLGPPAAACPP
jgi:hypothetical protein